MFIEIERITTTTYIKDINLIDTNMMGPRHYHGNKSIVIINIFILTTMMKGINAFPDIKYLHELKGQQGAWFVSASAFATCAVVNSSIECFGVNSYKNALPDRLGAWSTVGVGVFHSCGIKYSGEAECWGHDWSGENMLKAPTEQLCDLEVAPYHACGLRTDGTIECWGGDVKNEDDQSPKQWLPFGNRIFIQVSTNHLHTCAVFNDGAAQCIGDNSYLQAPVDPIAEENGEDDREIKFPEVGNGYMHISAGAYHTCVALYDGGMECWGRNDFMQAPMERFYPSRKETKFMVVSCGLFHCCAIRDDGAAECWGKESARCSNYWHGSPDCEPYYYPGSGKKFISIAAGEYHTCAVDDVGEMQCWGRNMNYEGPRNVNYNNWIAPQRTVEDQYYATSPFPGTCERLVTTRIDFKTRVNGSLSKFNINVFSRLLVSCLLFFYLS